MEETFEIGHLPRGYFDNRENLEDATRRQDEELTLAELLHEMQWHPVPSDKQTAAHSCAASSAWEDWAVVTDLNLVLTSPIRTAEAVELIGTLEVVSSEASVQNVKYADGETPDDDDKVRTYATGGAAQSYFVRGAHLVTDAAGKVKVECDDKDNTTFVFHLEAYRYVHEQATA